MKITDEERKELKELYESYKDTKDIESLKLLVGLIKTSKWYKNNNLTYNCLWDSSAHYYRIVNLKHIFDNLHYKVYHYNSPTPLIIVFLKSLIIRKYPNIYKPI